jgi:hypothetical protein
MCDIILTKAASRRRKKEKYHRGNATGRIRDSQRR